MFSLVNGPRSVWYCPAFPVPAFDQLQEILAGPPIDCGKRLVEQNQRGILHDQPSEENALELAGRSGLDRAAFEPAETDGG